MHVIDYMLVPITPAVQRLTIHTPLSLLSADVMLAELEALADSLDGKLSLLVEIRGVNRFNSPLVYPRYASLLRRYPELRIAVIGASRHVLYGLTIIVQIARAADRLCAFESESEALRWLVERPAPTPSGVG